MLPSANIINSVYTTKNMPELIIQAREAAISSHFSVNRILPFRKKRMVGPFIFMDHLVNGFTVP